MFGFSKTYKHKCCDGSVKIVYKNVDDAFPLFLKEGKAMVQGNVKIPATAQIEGHSEYESKIHGLLVGLDSLNNSLMMSFRTTYIVYQADPCSGYQYLCREIERIARKHQRLQEARLQIDGLIALAKCTSKKADFMELYQSIVTQIGGDCVVEGAKAAIEESTSVVKKWIGGDNAS